MAFELYNPEGPRRTREPTVTIYSGEQCFSLNRSAFSALGEPQQIHLYYDHDTRLVGIGPAAKRSPAALNLKTGRGGRYYRVGVTGFMRPRVLPSGWAVRLRRLLCSAYFKKSGAAIPVTYRTLERTAPLMPSCNRPVRGKRSV